LSNWEQISLYFRPKSKRCIKAKQKTEKKTDQTSIVWLNSGEIALDLTSSRQVKISSRRSKKRNTLLLIEELTGHRKKKGIEIVEMRVRGREG
jgi:hypothetical protein